VAGAGARARRRRHAAEDRARGGADAGEPRLRSLHGLALRPEEGGSRQDHQLRRQPGHARPVDGAEAAALRGARRPRREAAGKPVLVPRPRRQAALGQVRAGQGRARLERPLGQQPRRLHPHHGGHVLRQRRPRRLRARQPARQAGAAREDEVEGVPRQGAQAERCVHPAADEGLGAELRRRLPAPCRRRHLRRRSAPLPDHGHVHARAAPGAELAGAALRGVRSLVLLGARPTPTAPSISPAPPRAW